jgi:hypothetical protein
MIMCSVGILLFYQRTITSFFRDEEKGKRKNILMCVLH